MLQLYPLEFFQSTNGSTPPPRDPLLFEAVQKFCKAEFGEERNFAWDFKTWVVAEQTDIGYEVESVVSLRQMLDCYTFHVRSGGDNDLTRDRARQARNMMVQRAASYIQDHFGTHSRVLVYVAPTVERYWRGFLRLLKAKPANRWEVEV